PVACAPGSSCVAALQVATRRSLGESATEAGGEAYVSLLRKLAGWAEAARAMSGAACGRGVASLPHAEFVEWRGPVESSERLESALGDALLTATREHRQD